MTCNDLSQYACYLPQDISLLLDSTKSFEYEVSWRSPFNVIYMLLLVPKDGPQEKMSAIVRNANMKYQR